MKKNLLSRLDRAITCLNEYDSDRIFNQNLGEVKTYARLIYEHHCEHRVLREIIDIIKEAFSKTKHSKKEKKQIINKLRSIQEEHISWLIHEEDVKVSGELTLSVGPTIAPYILPKFIKHYVEDYPAVKLSVKELKDDAMLSELLLGYLDAGIAISGNTRQGVLEIPLYTEKFMVYLAENCWRKLPVFKPENLEHEKMWVMKEAQCLRESAFSFCKAINIYEAGSIETLIRIVDENGGFTIIPEMHLPLLTDKQRENVRRIEGDYLSQRRVSLYIREDYIRQSPRQTMCKLNTISKTLLRFMLEGMMEKRIVDYGIWL
ncbi:MAG: LysR family transcriptional regulator [Prevotella sp.]|nr:LysR family transcriptional regulator [Prevotella sp.]